MTTLKPLFDHQAASLVLLRQALATGSRRPMLQVATGGGKTRIAAEIVLGALRKGRRCVFTVPALALIDQTARAFWDEGIRDIGVMQADHPMTDPSRPVQIASVQTLERRLLPEADLVIVDEAHRRSKIIRKWMAETEAPFIGLSATPWSKGLGEDYDKLIIAATTAELIEKGYLSPFRVFAPSKPDLSKVRTVRGDYHEGELSAVMSDKVLVADVVTTWLEKAEGRPTLCFAVDRVHAKTLQVEFQQAGVACGYIDMNTPANEREVIRKQFARGELKVVTSVGTLTTGVDWDVRCISFCRPTKSEILYVQAMGRALRTAPGKDYALILDHSSTTLKLGLVTDIHHEEMHDSRKEAADKSTPEEREAPKPKECPNCHYVRPAAVRSCPSCGYVPEVVSTVKTVAGELVDITAHREAEATAQAAFIAQLRKYAEAKGKSDSWVLAQYKSKWKAWPTHPRVRNAPAASEVSPEVLRWIRSRNIAFAKGKARAHA